MLEMAFFRFFMPASGFQPEVRIHPMLPPPDSHISDEPDRSVWCEAHIRIYCQYPPDQVPV